MLPRKEKRFRIIEEEGLGLGAIQIVVDTRTGVHYLLASGTGGLAMTPLLDSGGRVVIGPSHPSDAS